VARMRCAGAVRNPSPGGAAAARSGVDAGLLEDRPYHAVRKLVAEPGEFFLDPPVTQVE
jgi:hypothetical protein